MAVSRGLSKPSTAALKDCFAAAAAGQVWVVDGGLATELEKRGYNIAVSVNVTRMRSLLRVHVITCARRMTLSGVREFCTPTPKPS